MTQEELQKMIQEAQLLNQKSKMQELLEKALTQYPDWIWAQENMKQLTEYWKHTYTEYDGNVDPLQHKKICVFAHYDVHKRIADYVVYWCKSLLEWDCAVIFVSTCETLSQGEINKIRPYVSMIIVRPNQGYDFGSYCVGFQKVKQFSHFEYFMIMNDSCFGPVHNLNKLDAFLSKSEDEVLGNSDFHFGDALCIQSFFYLFRYSDKVLDKVEFFLNQFVFTNNIHMIGAKCEVGFNNYLLACRFYVKLIVPLKEVELISTFTGMDAYLPFWRISIINFPTPFLKRIVFKKHYGKKEPLLTSGNGFRNAYWDILTRYNAFFEEKDLLLMDQINWDLSQIIRKEMF